MLKMFLVHKPGPPNQLSGAKTATENSENTAADQRRIGSGADCNFAAPQNREMPNAPCYPYFVVITPILSPPPDCRPGRFVPAPATRHWARPCFLYETSRILTAFVVLIIFYAYSFP